MKSIIEQASSIGKAIQNAWERAEQPKEFTVKIYQEAQRGFLGFNSTPAKVGIFFQEAQPSAKKVVSKKVESAKVSAPVKPVAEKSATLDKSYVADKTNSVQKDFAVVKGLEDIARPWITKTITLMKLEDTPFTVKTQRNNLVVTFTQPLFEDRLREKKLFSSLSLLTLVMLRNELNSDLRDIKVIIKRK